LDLYDTHDQVVLVTALAGAQKSDISIDFDTTTNEVVVSGEIKRPEAFADEAAQRNRRVNELQYGKFERRVKISADGSTKLKVDDISARFEDGLLWVIVPKAEVEAKRKIELA